MSESKTTVVADTTTPFAPMSASGALTTLSAPSAGQGRPPIDLTSVSVTIESALGIGGIYPFIAVCLDNDTSNELYKTAAKTGGQSPVKFNEVFDFNLAFHDKSRLSQGRPLPIYLTFYLYDVGDDNIPSLGSCGVLLETIRQTGVSTGDWQIINGTGKLSLFVTALPGRPQPSQQPQYGMAQPPYQTQVNQLQLQQQQQQFRLQQQQQQQQQLKQQEADQNNNSGGGKSWYKTDGAKVAAGIVGVGAIAAGVAAVAVGNKKKKNRKLQSMDNKQHLSGPPQPQAVEEEEDDEFDDEDFQNLNPHAPPEDHGGAPPSSSGHH